MSAHHFIQNHCTKCGVRRERVRVQGPCVWSKSVDEHYASLDPHDIKHVVVATQGDPDAFESEILAKQIRELINNAGKEGLGKILYGEKNTYDTRALCQMPPPRRSIEPHKKRREK